MSATTTLAPYVEGGSYFECPRWFNGHWWASDFYRKTVFAYEDDGREIRVLEVGAQPSGLGWLPNGDLLVVSMKDHRVLRVDADGAESTHADLSDLVDGHLNDMLVAPSGHAFVGSFGFDLMGGGAPKAAPLVRVDPHGVAEVVAEDLLFPNGMALSAEGTLIVAETLGSRLTAFDLGDDGELSNRRVWAQPSPLIEDAQDVATYLGETSFAPDGIALDAEGGVWAANVAGGSVVRVREDEGVVDEIELPDGLAAFACGLGGEDGTTIVVCAAPSFPEHERAPVREGVLLRGTVDVPAADPTA